MRCSAFVLFLLTLTVQQAIAAPVESFGDIKLWSGSGANQAALAIDFDGASSTDQALVWGYRWDGDKTVEDMLRSVVANDPRLFTNLGSTFGQFGRSLFGIGYDNNGNGTFSISNPNTDFGSDGIAFSTSGTPGIVANESGDLYFEGFTFGFFELSESFSDPFGVGQYIPASVGISGVVSATETDFLSDGQTAGLTWNDTSAGFVGGKRPENFVAALAIPEPSSFALLCFAGAAFACRRRGKL
ncbi:hypothetical protein LF1_28210 [Rubripirellula obstinata]|uniref:Ice-binding protein C-terminal domain-containing protein n=1 Tax=Rubripirellula obstinata TaxID=406547 RepID=A0A5B1CJ47_9BACT|nr:PEP-CTERM sorting domain-containing protein [Rubripirellula obstinata]KAA1260282.1 hypothetical protein LF1_28210 [Rubripirellula obstinata]